MSAQMLPDRRWEVALEELTRNLYGQVQDLAHVHRREQGDRFALGQLECCPQVKDRRVRWLGYTERSSQPLSFVQLVVDEAAIHSTLLEIPRITIPAYVGLPRAHLLADPRLDHLPKTLIAAGSAAFLRVIMADLLPLLGDTGSPVVVFFGDVRGRQQATTDGEGGWHADLQLDLGMASVAAESPGQAS